MFLTLHKSAENLTGRRFSRLVVVGPVERRPVGRKGHLRLFWLCQCDCGLQTRLEKSKLTGGWTKSCGCLHRDTRKTCNLRHGHGRAGAARTAEYRIWSTIKTRCTNPKRKDFDHYGGRGIKLCERWAAFENFYADMGPRPTPRHTVERRDRNANYEPDNCRWATWEEQANNTSRSRLITAMGRTLTPSQWEGEVGISAKTIRSRLGYGWSEEDAVTVPVKLHDRVRKSSTEYARRRRSAEERATPAWLADYQVFEMDLIRNEAKRAGMTVDHIVPLRGASAWGLNVPWNLQLMPADENRRKSNRYITKGHRI